MYSPEEPAAGRDRNTPQHFSVWPSRARGQDHLRADSGVYVKRCVCVCVFVYDCVHVSVCIIEHQKKRRKAQKRPFLSPLTLDSARPTRHSVGDFFCFFFVLGEMRGSHPPPSVKLWLPLLSAPLLSSPLSFICSIKTETGKFFFLFACAGKHRLGDLFLFLLQNYHIITYRTRESAEY